MRLPQQGGMSSESFPNKSTNWGLSKYQLGAKYQVGAKYQMYEPMWEFLIQTTTKKERKWKKEI